MQIAARRLALGVAQERDDDLRAQAVHGVRAGQVGLAPDFGTLDHLVEARCARSVAVSTIWMLFERTPGTSR